jgi:hypothetical protein
MPSPIKIIGFLFAIMGFIVGLMCSVVSYVERDLTLFFCQLAS